eukprot:scaffold17459_cov54-Attheya_sp.AAC.9
MSLSPTLEYIVTLEALATFGGARIGFGTHIIIVVPAGLVINLGEGSESEFSLSCGWQGFHQFVTREAQATLSSAYGSHLVSGASFPDWGITVLMAFIIMFLSVNWGLPHFLRFWTQAARSCLGSLFSGSLASLPIQISCLFLIMF